MDYIIETNSICKNYGKLKAVDRVSIGVKQGEIYGFLGLNGAGKTTTIRMLLGMINPSEGTAHIGGKRVNPAEKNIWSKVGYMVEIPYAYPELTVKENLELFRKLHILNDVGATEKIMDTLNLKQYKNVKARHLSQGNAQRLGIAKALLHNPEILILDEPSNGLDPVGIVEIRELLKKLAKNEGKTIFISSHILAEISKIADRIGIIHHGKLIKEIDESQLEKERIKKLLINTRNNAEAIKLLSSSGYKAIINDDGCLEIADHEVLTFPEKLAELLVNHKQPPVMINIQTEDLEGYFLRIIENKGGLA